MTRLTTIAAMLAMAVAIGCNSGSQPEVAKTPDEAVTKVVNAIAENDPQVAWYHLPDSYQSDVEGLVHEFGDKMDKDVYSKAVSVAQKAVKVMKEKRDYILGNSFVKSSMEQQADFNPEDAEKSFDAAVNMFETLVNSKLSSLDELKDLDVGEFLEDTGGELMNEVEAASKLSPDDQFTEFVTKAKSIKATVIDQSGDEATVKIEVEGEDPEEMKFTKVEGKWIPAEIAEGWEENIAEAKQNMQDLPQELQQAKPQVMGGLAMVESVLDSMLKAESQQEFDQAIGGVLGLMGGGMSPPGGSGFGPAGGSGTSPDFEFDDLPEPDADDVDVDVEENEAEVEVPTGSAE